MQFKIKKNKGHTSNLQTTNIAQLPWKHFKLIKKTKKLKTQKNSRVNDPYSDTHKTKLTEQACAFNCFPLVSQ